MVDVLQHYSTEDYFKQPAFYSRIEWGAAEPKRRLPPEGSAIILVFKKTQTDPCYDRETCMSIIREIQQQDMEEGERDDIQYNFLIGNDGSIYEGRGWETRPDPYPKNSYLFLKQLNMRSLLIGLIGDFEEVRHPQKQEFSVLHLIGEGVTKGHIHEDATFINYESQLGYEKPRYDLGV